MFLDPLFGIIGTLIIAMYNMSNFLLFAESFFTTDKLYKIFTKDYLYVTSLKLLKTVRIICTLALRLLIPSGIVYINGWQILVIRAICCQLNASFWVIERKAE